MIYTLILVASVAARSVAAGPVNPVVVKLEENRFQYVNDDSGIPHLADLWLKISDVKQSARYNPDSQNVYHLFTRSNPSLSQVLVPGVPSTVIGSNFDGDKRTAVVIHGWTNDVTSPINTVLVPAFLSAEDMNVIVVDWNAGAGTPDYSAAVLNTVTSGESVARFITWLNSVSGSSVSSYHIVGHSLGGQQAGIIGRNLGGLVPHITALDPAWPGWITNTHRFRPEDGIYTEVIHSNSGVAGYLTPTGDVDFYPNGGVTMPGCSSQNCDHNRAYYYFGESVSTGGFKGRSCASYLAAVAGTCSGEETLCMGGIYPKTGRKGIFYLETNAAPPFAKG